MLYLKADTAIKVVVGPAVAVGDGFTPVTTLALSTADEAKLMKHDASSVTDISGNTFAAITGMDGYYNLTITAEQLDTEGMLVLGINDDSLILPIRHEFMVVNANVFDSLFAIAGTDLLDVNVEQVDGQTTVDGTRTFVQAFRLMLATLGGKLAGAATTNVTIRDIDDGKDVVDATVDSNGNRSAVTLDLS